MHSLFGTARDQTWDLSIPSRTFYHCSTATLADMLIILIRKSTAADISLVCYFLWASWQHFLEFWNVLIGFLSGLFSSVLNIVTTIIVSSVMGRDDSWPATVPSVVPTADCSHWSIHYIHKANQPNFCLNWQSANPENPKWRNRTSGREFDGRFWISPVSCSRFLVTICLSRLVSEIFACDRQTDRQTDGQRGPLL